MKFLEGNQIQSAFVPVDMSAAANAGDWVNLENYERCAVVLFKGAGTAGDDPTFKVQQATANDGTGAKDLDFETIWTKVGSQATTGQFTKNSQTADTEYTDATSAEAEGMFVAEFSAEDLDAANGFTHLQLSVADVGTNAQLGCGFYILLGPKYSEEPALSAID